jgi:hypothetical protein
VDDEYRRTQVVQWYMVTCVVHGYTSTAVLQGTGVVRWFRATGVEQKYNVYRSSTGVQVSRCCTVLQGYRNSRVVLK